MSKEKRTGEALVALYTAKIGDEPTLEQQLLLQYMVKYEKYLPVDYGDTTQYHKAFRQVDICRRGHEDMLVYSLMHCDDIIWTTLEEFYA